MQQWGQIEIRCSLPANLYSGRPADTFLFNNFALLTFCLYSMNTQKQKKQCWVGLISAKCFVAATTLFIKSLRSQLKKQNRQKQRKWDIVCIQYFVCSKEAPWGAPLIKGLFSKLCHWMHQTMFWCWWVFYSVWHKIKTVSTSIHFILFSAMALSSMLIRACCRNVMSSRQEPASKLTMFQVEELTKLIFTMNLVEINHLRQTFVAFTVTLDHVCNMLH